MDVCVRVISVFKCHKACPLTAASSIAVAALLPGSLVSEVYAGGRKLGSNIRIGHPSGVMTMKPELVWQSGEAAEGVVPEVPSVAVQRTARRIMDGFVYVRN